MKIKKKTKKVSAESSSKSHSPMGSADWMLKSREDMNRAVRKQEADSKRSRRPPNIYLGEDESKMIRFLSSDPIAAIWRYSLKVNGKWMQVTMPAPGETDRMKRAGLKPGLKFVYGVIDKTGYVDKTTKKKMKNLPRYLEASPKTEKQLEKIRQKRGGLSQCDMEYCRSGSSTDTQYNFILEDKTPLEPAFKAQLATLEKEFAQYYAPPTEEEQLALISGITDED